MTIDTKHLRELLDKATPGPWAWKQTGDYETSRCVILWPATSKGGTHYRRLDSIGGILESDAELIVQAKHKLPAILDELDALRSDIAEAKGQIEHLDRQNNALRNALQWYGEKAKSMGSAAIQGDSKGMLALMHDVAVDDGGRARAALADRPAPAQPSGNSGELANAWVVEADRLVSEFVRAEIGSDTATRQEAAKAMRKHLLSHPAAHAQPPVELTELEQHADEEAEAARVAMLGEGAVVDPNVYPGEAVFGFAAWLTTLENPVTFSCRHGAAIGAELAIAYNKSQGFEAFREDYHARLKPYPAQPREGS